MSGYFVPILWLFGHEHHKDHEGSTYGDRKPGPPTHKLPPNTHELPTTGGTTGDPGGSMPMDMVYHFESPCLTPEIAMNPVNKRSNNPVETPKPKRVYEDPDPRDHKGTDVRRVKYTGPSYTAGWCRDFSAIQRTRVNPVTGRIIGYKGIPRKRALSPTSKYSSFWREQKYAKPSLHAARSPGIWDSARR